MNNISIHQTDSDYPSDEDAVRWRDELLGLPDDEPPEKLAYELASGDVVDVEMGENHAPF